AHRQAIEAPADRDGLADPPHAEGPHVRALAPAPHGEARGRQRPERLAHGREAHVELLGQLRLAEPLARRVDPGEDGLTDEVRHLVPQRLPVDSSGLQVRPLPEAASPAAGTRCPPTDLLLLRNLLPCYGD